MVISIIVIIAGIGVSNYKRLAGESTLYIATSQVRQLINATISNARRNNIPTQIVQYFPDTPDTTASTFYGGTEDSLIAYWDFEGDTETNALTDFKNNTLTKSGSPIWTHGKTGKCYEINGSNQYFALTFSDTRMKDMKHFYMEVSIQVDSTSTTTSALNDYLISLGAANKYIGVVIYKDGTNHYAHARGNHDYNMNTPHGEAAYDFPNSNIYPVIPFGNHWHKVGISYNTPTTSSGNAVARFYMNGELIGKKLLDTTIDGTETLIVGGGSIRGKIDDVKIYDYTRGASYSTDPKNVFIASSNTSSTSYPISATGKSLENDYYIGIASQYIKGKFSSLSSSTLAVSSSSIKGNFPTEGYLAAGNNYNGYALYKYTNYNSGSFTISEENLNNIATVSLTTIDYVHLAKPIIISANGIVK